MAERHQDIRVKEGVINDCEKSLEWLAYHGKPCDGRDDHISEIYIGDVSAKMTVPYGRSERYIPPAARAAIKELLTERWPELSLALRVKLIKHKMAARAELAALGKQLIEDNS